MRYSTLFPDSSRKHYSRAQNVKAIGVWKFNGIIPDDWTHSDTGGPFLLFVHWLESRENNIILTRTNVTDKPRKRRPTRHDYYRTTEAIIDYCTHLSGTYFLLYSHISTFFHVFTSVFSLLENYRFDDVRAEIGVRKIKERAKEQESIASASKEVTGSDRRQEMMFSNRPKL